MRAPVTWLVEDPMTGAGTTTVTFSRRGILRLSLISGAVALCRSSLAQQPLGPAVRPAIAISIEDWARRYESAFRLTEDERLLATYAYIATQADLVQRNQKTTPDAVADIKAAIEKGRYEYPKELGSIGRWLDSDPDLSKVFVRMLTGGAVAAGAASLLFVATPPTAIVAAGAAGAAAMLGISLDYVIDNNWVSAYGYLFPAPSHSEVLGLAAWATTAYREQFNSSVLARALALEVVGLQGFQSQAPHSRTTRKQTLASKAAARLSHNTDNTRPPEADEFEAMIQEELRKRLERINAFTNTRDRLEDSAAKHKAEQEYVLAEINGFGTAMNFVFTHFFQDPKTGERIQNVAVASSYVFMAATTTMGPWAIAGMLVSAVGFLQGGGQANDYAWRAAVVARLDVIIKQLNWIADTQVRLLKLCREIYESNQRNAAAIQRLTRTLDSLAADTHEADVTIARRGFLECKDKLAVFVANHAGDPSKASVPEVQSYVENLTQVYTYAHRTARDPVLSMSERWLTAQEIVERVRKRARCDQLVEALLHAASAAKVSIPGGPAKDDSRPVNPIAWAEGVTAFIESQLATDLDAGKINESQCHDLWWDGWKVGELIRSVVNLQTVEFLRGKLLEAAGFTPSITALNQAKEKVQVQALAKDNSVAAGLYETCVVWDNENVKRSIKPIWVCGTCRPVRTYASHTHPNFKVIYTFENDFVSLLEKEKIAALETVKRETVNLPRHVSLKVLKVQAEGNLKGSSIAEVLSYSNILVYPAEADDGTIKARYGNFQPTELQARARKVALEYHYRPFASRSDQMPLVVSNYFKGPGGVSVDYDYYGSLLRVVSAFTNWRVSPSELGAMPFLATTFGPFTFDDVPSYINRYIETSLSRDGYWPTEVLLAWHDAINKSCDRIIEAMEKMDEDRSVDSVDVTLRRLTALMAAKRMKLPEPPSRGGARP